MTTPNTQSIPDQRTRDMGVADTPAAPAFPFASPAEMFAAAEKYFGTRQLSNALKTLRYDRGFTDRSLAANPAEIASIRALAGPRIHAEMVAALDEAATADFFPGIAA